MQVKNFLQPFVLPFTLGLLASVSVRSVVTHLQP